MRNRYNKRIQKEELEWFWWRHKSEKLTAVCFLRLLKRDIYIRVLTSIFYPNRIDYQRFQYWQSNIILFEWKFNWTPKSHLLYFILWQFFRYLQAGTTSVANQRQNRIVCHGVSKINSKAKFEKVAVNVYINPWF